MEPKHYAVQVEAYRWTCAACGTKNYSVDYMAVLDATCCCLYCHAPTNVTGIRFLNGVLLKNNDRTDGATSGEAETQKITRHDG